MISCSVWVQLQNFLYNLDGYICILVSHLFVGAYVKIANVINFHVYLSHCCQLE